MGSKLASPRSSPSPAQSWGSAQGQILGSASLWALQAPGRRGRQG